MKKGRKYIFGSTGFPIGEVDDLARYLGIPPEELVQRWDAAQDELRQSDPGDITSGGKISIDFEGPHLHISKDGPELGVIPGGRPKRPSR